MKIYVDELPKDIAQRRRCFDGYVLNCVELMFDSSYEPKQIALLSDYTKQVRKEVCEEIKDTMIMYGTKTIYNSNGDAIGTHECLSLNEIKNILDQIQGE